jgi:hypothetical protein
MPILTTLACTDMALPYVWKQPQFGEKAKG